MPCDGREFGMTDIKTLISKNKTASLLLLVAVFGGLLLIFGGNTAYSTASSENTANEEYITDVENKIIQMIKQVSRGEVSVIVTAESSEEFVFAENTEEMTEKSSNETIRTSKSNQYAVVNGQTVVKTVLKPKLRGIAVVCQNGDDPVLQYKIIKLLSCAYGISEAKICVAGL